VPDSVAALLEALAREELALAGAGHWELLPELVARRDAVHAQLPAVLDEADRAHVRATLELLAATRALLVAGTAEVRGQLLAAGRGRQGVAAYAAAQA
jgi:hypothetical protein